MIKTNDNSKVASHKNQKNDMRKEWEIKKLGEIIKLEYGKPLDNSKRKPNGKYPVYGANGEKDRTDQFYYDKKSIIVGRKGSAGEINLTENKFWPLDVTYFVTFDESENNFQFIYHLLNSLELPKLARGVKPGINRNEVYEINVAIPSLAEQKRIVEILDEAFAAIDKAKANVEKNLQNAKEFFESYLQNVFENKGEDWEENSLQAITKIINGYAFASNDFKSTNTVKSVKITNVGVKEFVEETDNYLPEKFKNTLPEFQVKKGYIVIALTRTIISAGLKVAVVPSTYDGALLNQRVAALVPNGKLINQSFLFNYLKTDGVAKYVLAHVNTLMQPNLSITDLKNLIVPYPSIKKQEIIVNKLDELNIKTKKLETIYQQKLNDLEELKKSILQKAFNGELSEAGFSGLKDKQDLKAEAV